MELRIDNLTQRYRGVTALKGVCTQLRGGDTCLLLGPNGSGKTTLMKLIAGIASPSSGEITLGSMSIGPKTKARIAYMPTENYFYNYMSVRDAGKYYADFFADFDRAAYEARIDRAELDPRAFIRTLSSGMSAKLRLSLILSRDAQVMMFDEPINGVDMLTRDWVLDEIAARRSPDRILLIFTHLVEQAERLANCALFLRRGELVREGAMDALCRESSLEDLYREVYGSRREEEASC